MKKFNAKKLFAVFLSLAIIAVIAFTMSACTREKPQDKNVGTTESTATAAESTTKPVSPINLGEGETSFLLDVYHKDGSLKKFEMKTNKKTVGEALLELEVIEGEASSYGLYVKTVDGETLDYDKDKMYWSFYVGGEYAQKGVDQTEIVDGTYYAFKAEK